jgi:hypothetical protein
MLSGPFAAVFDGWMLRRKAGERNVLQLHPIAAPPAKILRHAELVELDDGRLAAVCHVRAERVRPLIERLTARSYRVEFSSQPPTVWAADVAGIVS